MVDNGTRTAEEHAHAAALSALRSSQKAEAATNAVLVMQQALGRVEREQGDLRREHGELRREVNEGFADLAREIRSLKPTHRQPSQPSITLDDLDYTETPTGSYKLTPDTFGALLNEHKIREDGMKWRRTWRKARGAVWTIVGAGGALALEQLVRALFHI